MVETLRVKCRGSKSRACFSKTGSFHAISWSYWNTVLWLLPFQITSDTPPQRGRRLLQLRPRPEDIPRLKSPLGQLLTGVPGETMVKLKLLIERDRPPVVVTVGDIVSIETLKAGIRVNLRIVDYRSMREPVPRMSFPTENTYRAKNPPGGITTEAWHVIKRALEEREAVIVVDGEEDLLALPAIVESPDNAFVVYGQPSQGLVVVTATPVRKSQIRKWLDAMTEEDVS